MIGCSLCVPQRSFHLRVSSLSSLSSFPPRRLAWCITDLDPGGAERALVQIATRLNPAEFEQHVFCLQPPGALVGQLEAAGIPVTCLSIRSRWDWRAIRKLTRELRRFRPDILQTFLFHANVAGSWAAWRAAVPHLCTGVRVAERRSPWYLRLERWSTRRADRIVCVSHDVARFVTEQGGFDPQRLYVIPNGVDAVRFANAQPLDLSAWGIRPGDQVWVTVGRLDAQKGPEILLAAVARLRDRYPRLRLLWAGVGPQEQEIRQQIAALKLTEQVLLLGYCEQIPELLRAAEGFVLASRWEGMPNAVLEAQAAGLPVVCTAAEGVRDIVTPEITGLVVPLGDATGLADAWERCLQAPEFARELGRHAAEISLRERSWEQIAEQYAAVYREIATN